MTPQAVRYIRFADQEAKGRSPLYETLARGVAGDPDTIAFLQSLPQEKQQPNLLLAAMRHLFGLSPDWLHFRQTLLANRDSLAAFMLSHATQTNEPARCATLLPVLALLPQPIALIEVGASAGLCLLPDCYGYDYGDQRIHPLAATDPYPIFACSANQQTPRPTSMPRIVWRAGLDLNPLDVTNPAQAAWLKTLVWPEQTGRLANLQAALDIAAIQKPPIIQANLRSDTLAQICDQAPCNATLVIFHTAVLAYLTNQHDRQAFAAQAMSLADYWISNESPGVFPESTSHSGIQPKPGWFLLTVNASPVAWTDPHGAALDWIADKDGASRPLPPANEINRRRQEPDRPQQPPAHA
jgi:hypothetical protein